MIWYASKIPELCLIFSHYEVVSDKTRLLFFSRYQVGLQRRFTLSKCLFQLQITFKERAAQRCTAQVSDFCTSVFSLFFQLFLFGCQRVFNGLEVLSPFNPKIMDITGFSQVSDDMLRSQHFMFKLSGNVSQCL